MRLVQLIIVPWDLLALIYQVNRTNFSFSCLSFNGDKNPATHSDVSNSHRVVRVCSVCCTRFPTSISVSPENAVPDNKATSCLANVRGEEENCILGIV